MKKVLPQDRAQLAQLVDHFNCAKTTAADGKYVPGPWHKIQDEIREDQIRAWPGAHEFSSASRAQRAKGF